MLQWSDFKRAAPDIAAIGERLLHNPDAGEVAILATVDHLGRPWVAPFCPVFADRGMYLLAAAETPKVRHLAANSAYALHAMVGTDDLEFQVAGTTRLVRSDEERQAVIAAVPFPSFDANDPIFELQIGRALSVSWPQPGRRQKLAWAHTE